MKLLSSIKEFLGSLDSNLNSQWIIEEDCKDLLTMAGRKPTPELLGLAKQLYNQARGRQGRTIGIALEIVEKLRSTP
jgi:hypothetical protein